MNDEELTLLCEAIGMLAKVYLMTRSGLPLTEKQIDDIKSIINTYVDIVE
jgi:hypothetical protein